MSFEDRAYFAGRAEQELRMAQQARRPEVVRAHYDLANLYLDRVYPEDLPAERGRRRRGEDAPEGDRG